MKGAEGRVPERCSLTDQCEPWRPDESFWDFAPVSGLGLVLLVYRGECAGSWAADGPGRLQEVHVSGRAQGQLSWMT